MRRIAVIDSSCLIYLTHLQLTPRLVLYFDRIYVPRRVHEEVSRKHRFRRQLRKLYDIGPFEKCICGDKYNVQLLEREQDLDGGEAEGLVQAQEKEAYFFIADEIRAREIGGRLGLVLIGTVGLLARLCRDGYAEDIHRLVRRLRTRGFFVTDAVVEQAIY